jgi:ketosteroid isomerase-like protein
MSRENVEVVRALYEAWNAGDMDAVRELYDPDVIVRNIEGLPETGPFVGRDATMRFWEQQRATWDRDFVTPISLVDAGDRVAVRQTWHGTGHGPDFDTEFTCVWTVRGGKIHYQEFFWDHAEALAALGLPEQ